MLGCENQNDLLPRLTVNDNKITLLFLHRGGVEGIEKLALG